MKREGTVMFKISPKWHKKSYPIFKLQQKVLNSMISA